jgi:hypothetical protein
VEDDPWKARQAFFFEKRKQKLLSIWRTRRGNANALLTRFFWFFFAKKNYLLSALCRIHGRLWQESLSSQPAIIPMAASSRLVFVCRAQNPSGPAGLILRQRPDT